MMKTARQSRLLAMILLATFLSGCSTWQPAFPPGDIPLDQTENSHNEIHRGAIVRIKLVSGQTIKGTVARTDSEAVYLDKSGNYGYEELRIDWEEMASMEVHKPTGTSNILLTTTGVVAGLVMVVFIGLSNMNWGPN
jgi:hypothetical protein|nr:hypothetical protein [Candidatus Krumholzibacteria bacterium]